MTLAELLKELADIAEVYGDTTQVNVLIQDFEGDKLFEVDDLVPIYSNSGDLALFISFLRKPRKK